MDSASFEKELVNILDFWAYNAYDQDSNLFFGRIDNEGNIFAKEPLGSVLYTRILWSFSAGYSYTRNPIYKERALQSYKVIKDYFFDPKYGGLYWSVAPNGEPLEQRKQIYAQAFGIYALVELYKIEPNKVILNDAIELFNLIESHSYDIDNKGYIDAFSFDWQPVKDMRLSEKDMNAPKTMNTHLHLLEAYSNLYTVNQNEKLKSRIIELLHIFSFKIMDSKKKYLRMFFTKDWMPLSTIQSYGHDIEASWLLMKAAENVYIENIPQHILESSNSLALSSLAGVQSNGSMANEKEGELVNKERHWWVQAEAVVGFYYLFLRTHEKTHLHYATMAWQYIEREIKDEVNGEWFWGRDEDGNVLQQEDKVGMWKCPYHNSRACLEMLSQL